MDDNKNVCMIKNVKRVVEQRRRKYLEEKTDQSK